MMPLYGSRKLTTEEHAMTETLLDDPRTATAPFAVTLADVLERLKDYPPDRILWTPTPGTATEEDVVARGSKGVELIDGTLVEKAMGAKSSVYAARLVGFLFMYLDLHPRGFAYAPDMIIRTGPNQLRLPDAGFYSWTRWPGRIRELPNIMAVMPELAVELLSDGNTKDEMERKRREYFDAGIELVWIVDPMKFTIQVFTSSSQQTLLKRGDTLDGGAVLPGFTLPLAKLFDDLRDRVDPVGSHGDGS